MLDYHYLATADDVLRRWGRSVVSAIALYFDPINDFDTACRELPKFFAISDCFRHAFAATRRFGHTDRRIAFTVAVRNPDTTSVLSLWRLCRLLSFSFLFSLSF